MKPIFVIVSDKMQSNYSYLRTEPIGENFSVEFTPDVTPPQMLELGVFGGKYLNDCQNEFPKEWFTHAKLSPAKSNPKLNYFKVSASQSLSVWRQNGWIHPDDPRGWFQWYCRFYTGRRHPDDARQIKRWRMMKRHVSQVKNNCMPYDETCRPRQRQALLHWAYDARKI